MPPYVWALLIAGGVVLALVVVYLFLIKTAPVKRAAMERYGKTFAHRGLWDADAPENSLAAFEKAVSAGYGIEFDIHKTRDGHVVVFHDDTLTRMCGVDGKVEDKTLDELRALRLLGTEQGIPTLQELLALVDGRVPLLVELKGESVETGLCPVANEILSGYTGDYLVESFNPMLLRWYKKHRPDVMRGQLFCNLNNGRHIKKVVYSMISVLLTNVLARPHFLARGLDSERNPSFLICKHVFGAPSYVWTVRKPEQMPKDAQEGMIFEGLVPKK